MDTSAASALEIVSFSDLFGTQDKLEGIGAFLEKRPAKFIKK